MFAAPLSNVSAYPIQHDTEIPSFLLESTVNSRRLPTTKIALRQDFDFSFQGVPIWEYSDKSYLPTIHTYSESLDPTTSNIVPSKNFLSMSLPPVSSLADQSSSAYPAGADLLTKTVSYLYRHHGTPEEFTDLVEQGLDKCVFEEEWWQEFYIRMAEDRSRWRKVRDCMGRGKCRVVVRWQEVNRGHMMERNGDRAIGAGIGIGRQLEVLQENERTRASGNGPFTMPDDRGGMNREEVFGAKNIPKRSRKR
ncbi:hypothetical protein ACMFMG_007687 [Clarireedia jacksonii]